MNSTRELLFTEESLDAFAKLSGDRNPLHCDSSYARKTPFGERVVHGVFAAIAGLGVVAEREPLSIKNLQIIFKQAVFTGVAYSVDVASTVPGKQLTLSVRRASSVKLTIRLDYGPAVRWPLRDSQRAVDLRSTPDPSAPVGGEERRGAYSFNAEALDALGIGLGIDFTGLCDLQLAALCWCSYFVGMEVPGRQALFSTLSAQFVGEAQTGSRIQYKVAVDKVFPESGLVHISAALDAPAGSLATVKISAYARPLPVSYDFAALSASLSKDLGLSDSLRGKTALVTGASRGLGSLIAVALASRGCDLILHYHRSRQEVERVQEYISTLGRSATVALGDLRTKEGWEQLKACVASKLSGLDIFVQNAFSPVVPLAFDELSDEVLQDYVWAAQRAAVLGYRAFLPALEQTKGWAVTISSSYVVDVPANMAHYTMAKAATDALTQTLAREHRGIRFAVLRPPRLWTDMANVNALIPTERPERIARRLVSMLETSQPTAGTCWVETFKSGEGG